MTACFYQRESADLCSSGFKPSELTKCSSWLDGPDWLTDDFSKWSRMKVPDRTSEMSETRNSRRKEYMNAYATLMACNLQKGTAPRHTRRVDTRSETVFQLDAVGASTRESEKSTIKHAQQRQQE